MTQEQLADALGVNRATVSKYENGAITPSIGQAQKISAILDIPFLDFVGIEPENNNNSERKKLESIILEYANQNENYDLEKLLDIYFYDENGLRFRGNSSRVDELIDAFDSLNEEGQQKAVERVEELTEIPKYQRAENQPEPTQEAPGDKK